MGEIILINVGAFVTMFCAYKFAVNHLTKAYSGIFDPILRGVLVIGALSGSLLMPIWLQKSRYVDDSVNLFLIGAYAGIAAVGITAWLEKKGRLRWPKEMKSKAG